MTNLELISKIENRVNNDVGLLRNDKELYDMLYAMLGFLHEGTTMETTTERLSRELVLLERIEFRSMVRSGLIPEDTEEAFREWLGESHKSNGDNKS